MLRGCSIFEREIVRCRALILAVVLAILYASSTYAEIVQYRLTGTVSLFDRYNNLIPPDLVAGTDSDVLNPPGPNATGGKPFVAYWSYDNSVPDTAPEPYLGSYVHPLADPLTAAYGLTVHIDHYVFRMNTSIEPYTVGLSVGLLTPPDCDLGCGDGIGTNQTDVIVPFEYSELAGYPIVLQDRITLSINDSFQSTPGELSTFLTDELPGNLDIDDFLLGRIQIDAVGDVSVGSNLPPAYLIQGWISEITRVPEPSSVCVFFVAATCLFWRFRH